MDSFRLRANELDRSDPLGRFRDEFKIDPSVIYLDGNSLGRLPLRAIAIAKEVVEQQWGSSLVRGWGEGWYELPQRLGAKIAKLIGAQEDEVLVTDSTSVNFFKLVIAALRARPGRTKIISDTANFPADLYLLQGCADLLRGTTVSVVGIDHRPGGQVDIESEFAEHLDHDAALLSLSHVAFKSGQLYDMAALTEAAHGAGALTLWDLSHSVGALPIDLNGANADLAVGCCYKYLNGGPGAPAFLYVRRDLQEQLLSPIWGWFGQNRPFDFSLDYVPAPGLNRFLAGTPPILSMSLIEPGVDLLLEAGMESIREKSVAMTEFLIEMIDEQLVPLGFKLASPRDSARRGSHVSISHPEALRIDQALIEEMGVIPDFRRPDSIRLGVAPLYTTYAELVEAVERIATVVAERRFENYGTTSHSVT